MIILSLLISFVKAYYYLKGVQELASCLNGDEHICLAIRPYGFHAGNQLPFVIYPKLLCEEFRKTAREPRFTFFVVFNDWEQIKLAGPDIKRYPFNVLPLDTTLQYTSDPTNDSQSIVDLWAPQILEKVEAALADFPELQVKPLRYSSFRQNEKLLNVLDQTLRNPNILGRILKEYTTKEVIESPLEFVVAVCPKCKQTKGKTVRTDERVTHTCSHCGEVTVGKLEDFDYWFYHTPLALPRYEILSIDLCITGADKIDESDYVVRERLAEAYRINLRMPNVLYTQFVTDPTGERMGKSRGNHIYVDPQLLESMVLQNPNERILVVDANDEKIAGQKL